MGRLDEKQGHHKALSPSYHSVLGNTAWLWTLREPGDLPLSPLGPGFLGTSQQRNQAAISEKMGTAPVSMWHLRSLMGGRQILNSSSHGS